MKRMRKGIVVLLVAATGAVGVIGSASGAQAAATPTPVKVVTAQPYNGGGSMPNSMGSSWQ